MSQSPSSAVGAVALAPQLQGLAALAWLLERIESGGQRPDPAQYRLLVRRIAEQLEQLTMQPQLGAVLDRFPATADLYENLRYEWAGLCRAPLARSVGSERQARQVLQRVARAARGA